MENSGLNKTEEGDRIFFWPSEEIKQKACVNSSEVYDQAEKDPVAFWEDLASKGIAWFSKWEKAYEEKIPDFKWFIGAETNAAYNCLDRHLNDKGDKTALIWIPEIKEEEAKKYSYRQLYEEVNKAANVLKSLGVKKGDVVTIYLPMIPEIIISVLACARIGAVHSVVFSAYSAEALNTRLKDGGSEVMITSDGYYRKGKIEDLKKKANEGIQDTNVKKVLVVKRTGNETEITEKDLWWHEQLEKADNECEAVKMKSEDLLFLLYTSGTTGKPKGVMHDTGGYITQAYWTSKWDFDLHEDDVMWCTSDLGWVTGHSYVCYGPLLNGITTVLFEGLIDWPNPERPWEIIEEHKISVFYTAPTALRLMMSHGKEIPEKFGLESLRVLGSVGECIDQKTWLWYLNSVGKGKCPLIDTWWQTETGGTMINSLPGVGPFIPAWAGNSFPGTRHTIIDEEGNEVIKTGEQGYLVQKSPFAPGLLRGVWKNPERFKKTYWRNDKYYFSGDGAYRDDGGRFRIIGRLDDVLKVAGHRMSTGEMENVIDKHAAVNEAAVIGKPDELRGEVPVAFVITKGEIDDKERLEKELQDMIVKGIGPIAKLKGFYFVESLPKTRSGKIMRRILKSLIKGEEVGDISTLQNPESVEKLKEIIKG
ncbi:acetate--CoA ligase [Candidatus Woesearchaeota archaeon]|nr:acetate--CoA ligase [Candidatus Woesearchaeota archaeon]